MRKTYEETQSMLGCDDSVGKQDDFKSRAKRQAEEWACKDAHEKSWTYEMLRDGFIEGADWARSHLDSEGLVTMSQAQGDQHQAEVKELKQAKQHLLDALKPCVEVLEDLLLCSNCSQTNAGVVQRFGEKADAFAKARRGSGDNE